MSNTIKLNIPQSAAERVTKQWVQDTLRQFNSGDLSLNQTRDLIVGYFSTSVHEILRAVSGMPGPYDPEDPELLQIRRDELEAILEDKIACCTVPSRD